MQSILINDKITNEKIISQQEYKNLENNHEFILYSDNILEGITLLNDLTLDENLLTFCNVVYDKIDQPIYIFCDSQANYYSIKICGAYEKWDLPEEVSRIIHFVDLPDYILYSISSKRVILAGENTETASVGNSQWQREGRKLGAALIGVPFIYQTFYSGRDESQNTIREPSSLQVYNQLLYSIRYKVPSFVAYFENNFENSQTRTRTPVDSKEIFVDYIKSVILCDVDANALQTKKQFEKLFFMHMIDYLKESKYADVTSRRPRLFKDLPSINTDFYNEIISNTNTFVDGLISYLYENNPEKVEQYLSNCKILDFDPTKYQKWTSYNLKKYIRNLIYFLNSKQKSSKTYISGGAKVGFADTQLCGEYLKAKFPAESEKIDEILDSEKYPESLLLPLRIHKVSKGKLTFSPDPESGEIVAFSELFSKDLRNKKCRRVIGYCIVDTPSDFDILNKKGTKLYKALAEYVDVLIINDQKIYFDLPHTFHNDNFVPSSIEDTNQKGMTEEMAVVSTYLNQSTINGSWKMCFIHTHHSSWQQFMIRKGDRIIQEKIDRVSTKVDLIMQLGNKFMIAEGKDTFREILADGKIQRAMSLASQKIDILYGNNTKQFDAFVYNLHIVQTQSPEYVISREVEAVKAAINRGLFDNIAYLKSFVIIIVYLSAENTTKFKLVYSAEFDEELKEQLNQEFCQ